MNRKGQEIDRIRIGPSRLLQGALELAVLMCPRSAYRHTGPRSCPEPHFEARHMNALDHTSQSAKTHLHPRGHPHMK
jgi:hypothetical protein